MFIFEFFSKFPYFLGIRYIHNMQEDILNEKEKKFITISRDSEETPFTVKACLGEKVFKQ